MKAKLPLLLVFISALLTALASCKRLDEGLKKTIIDTLANDATLKLDELPADSVPFDAVVYNVGTGTGDLVINGSQYDRAKNTFVRIKAGSYKTITIKNFMANFGKRIFIKNHDGEVRISEALYTNNLENVTISGNNVTGVKYGIKFENIQYRAITMANRINGVTLRNLCFNNVADRAISGTDSNGPGLKYLGTQETKTTEFKVLACSFNNAGPISFGGNLNKEQQEDNGFFEDVEIAFNEFKNSPYVGSVCYFSNVANFSIHHNTVTNINQNNNNHNGIFWMQGNGTFHHNKLLAYQGNAIRMWIFSRGKNPATVKIYNNICHNSRKYGAFELQAFDRQFVKGKTTFANAKVYNNTVGRMNTSGDWEGQILDLYHIGGSVEFCNNLGFNLIAHNKPLSNMVNNMSGSDIKFEKDNKYAAKHKGAVIDLIEFRSKFPGIGAK